MRVAGGGGHLDTHQGPWVFTHGSGRCVREARGRGEWGKNAEKRRVHVPCAAGAPRGEQRVSDDVPSWSFGFRVQGAGGYGAFVAVQRGPAGLPGRGSTCLA